MCNCFFIMRIYNTKQWLSDAIESVLNQTDGSLLLFLFDNGSTDGCKEICESYKKKDSRIILYRTEENRHFSDLESQKVIKKAFMESGANYYAILDSDDKYSENFLEETIKIARKEDADVVVAGWEKVKLDGSPVATVIPVNKIISQDRKMTYDEMKNLHTVFHTMWNKLYRASMYVHYWNAIQKLPSNALNGGDIYLMRHIMIEATKIVCIPTILHLYRWRHRENTYAPIVESEWLSLAPVRNYLENEFFFDHFIFSKKDKRKLQKWNRKYAYANMCNNCDAIVNYKNENVTFIKKIRAINVVLSNENFLEFLYADWRIAIVIRRCIEKVEEQYGELKCYKDICPETKKEWSIIMKKSSFVRCIVYDMRRNVMKYYLNRKSAVGILAMKNQV